MLTSPEGTVPGIWSIIFRGLRPYVSIPDDNTSQGSTMYLLEDASRALLTNTPNPAKATDGVDDLETVVRNLLGHEEDGKPRVIRSTSWWQGSDKALTQLQSWTINNAVCYCKHEVQRHGDAASR